MPKQVKKLHIAFSYNIRHEEIGLGAASQAEAEFDDPTTIAAIRNSLEESGYRVTEVEANEDAYEKFRSLRGDIDLVFNIAEMSRGKIREAQIPAILELLGIPYTHSDALTNAISLDKSLTKIIWSHYGLATPKFFVVPFDAKPKIDGLKFFLSFTGYFFTQFFFRDDRLKCIFAYITKTELIVQLFVDK